MRLNVEMKKTITYDSGEKSNYTIVFPTASSDIAGLILLARELWLLEADAVEFTTIPVRQAVHMRVFQGNNPDSFMLAEIKYVEDIVHNSTTGETEYFRANVRYPG